MPIDIWKEEPFGTYSLRGMDHILQKISSILPNTFLTFKIALVLRKLVLRKKIQVVDVDSVDKLKMRVYPLDNVGDRLALFMPWYFERDEFSAIRSYFFEGGVFIDIGANTGYYTLLASRVAGKEGKVLSFEPNAVAFNRMTFNMRNNASSSNISSFNFGLADKEGEFELGVDPGNLGGGTIVEGYRERGYDVQKVKCRLLTDVLKEEGIQRLDFMKIDVEEAEPIVLNPFFETASKEVWPKYILIESTEGIPFGELGYKEILKTKNNTIFKLESIS